jgi:hypothetical protein
MADGTLKVGEITNSAGSGNITIGSGVTVNVNRPSFFVHAASAQAVADSTDTKVNLDTESWDTDSAFDTSNYRFTVPSGQAGKYMFNAGIAYQNLTDNDEARVMFFKNGSLANWWAYFQGQNGTIRIQNSYVIDLNVGDYIELYAYQVSGGSKNTDSNSTNTYLSGFKIGA